MKDAAGRRPQTPLTSLPPAPLASNRSDVHEISRPGAVIDFPVPMPYAARQSDACELLSRMALDHASTEPVLARRDAEDALLMIESLSSANREHDRAMAARAAMVTGDAFLLLHEAHRAQTCFEIAIRFFDATDDRASAAHARVGLSKALILLHHPSVRTVLEDAGELFEDLGNDAAVHAIDLALRQVEAELEASPRSFHSASFRPRPDGEPG